ncbi:MAG: GNAT family N-acetyltransferase [Pseudomonadota bacterium]
MTVRRLGAPDDLDIFRVLRLEMLQAEPSAYASTYEDALALDQAGWLQRMAQSPMWALFDNGEPAGLMAYQRAGHSRMRHRAMLIMVWVRPGIRGAGQADLLLDAVLEGARAEGVDQMELNVLAANTRAVRFYARNGFRIVGTIPNAFRDADGDHDDHVMARWLKA